MRNQSQPVDVSSYSMIPNPFSGPDWQTVARPGISAATLAANHVRRVKAAEAEQLCGASMGGIWIPYRQIDDAPIREDNSDFGRLRLAVDENGRKYHSRAGSRSHLFVSSALGGLVAQPGCSTIVLTEGEFKAMSLCEHGVAAAGVAGITNATPQNKLLGELQTLLEDWPVEHVVFAGDADVGINADFSRAMVKLSAALPHDVDLSVIVPGLESPAKGIDDVRGKLGAEFGAYWDKLIDEAVPVPRGTPWESLALALLKRESPAAIAAIVNASAQEEAA